MAKKAAAILLSTAIIAAGGLALAYRDDLAPSAVRILALVSSAGADEPATPAAGPPAPQVPVAEVIVREITPAAEFTGFVAATRTVELRPRVGGLVEAVSVPEGGLVQAGQLLFRIDPRPFQVAMETAEAQLRQAEALLAQAEADFGRADRLAPAGTISRKAYDDALAKRRERQAQVETARATVAAARLDLSYTRVTAPIAGRVDRAIVTEGNLVTGGGAGEATLLTSIVSIDPVHVYFDIDEPTYLDFVARARPDAQGRAAIELPVRIGVMTDKGFPHAGVLDFIGNQVDRGTGTVRARAVIPNPDGRLTPGLFARVSLVIGLPRPTVLVDDQAIGTDQGRRYVLALGPENTATYRPVELGRMAGGLRVVTEGLEPGDNIIVKGLVRPGMQVQPRRVSMDSAVPGDLALQEAGR